MSVKINLVYGQRGGRVVVSVKLWRLVKNT